MKLSEYAYGAVLICFIVFFFVGQSDSQSSCMCGRAKKGESKQPSTRGNRRTKRATSNRIVNGYEPNIRPWMAFLNIEGSGICGGAILNKYWVLSAAHCFCAMTPCSYEGKTTIKFNISIVTVFLGQHDISRRFYNRRNIFQVKEIIIYPTYKPGVVYHNDLALLKLSRRIRFNKYRMPICLPSEDTKDTKVNSFVSGWGLLQGKNCTTNDDGPVKHQECSLPFMWKGIKISKCVHTLTPSADNPKCKNHKKLISYNSKEYNGVQLIDENKETNKCYSESPKSYGWCATCVKDASEGEPGYCGPITKKGRRAKRKNYGAPTFEENWGWCSKNCVRRKARSDRTNILQETKLFVMSDKVCKKMGKTMKVNTKQEICAGKKKKFKGFKSYRKTSKGYVKTTNKVSKGVYFGGSDSCTGDSGGPLYTWNDNIAVIIGVVSRGYGCALYNQAGVYGRLGTKMKWIKGVIKDGECSKAERNKSLKKWKRRQKKKSSKKN